MVPDPAQQFPSPYVGMGNHWVSGVDPDGRAWFVPIIIGAAIGGFGNLAIQHHQGNINSLSDGLLAFGKGAAVGAAVGSGVGKIAAIKAMPVHATQSAILAATKPAMAMSAATATNASVLIGGGLNVVNNYNPEQGIGLHTLGHFVAGAVGSYLGITEGGGAGFFAGGSLNMASDILTGQVENRYGAFQSFVGGGLSAMAGRNFYNSLGKKWGLDAIGNPEARIMNKFASYGLQNVASNFAFDSRQEFFSKPLAMHGAAFMVGGIGASLQGGIMNAEFGRSTLGNFGARLGLSSAASFSEYTLNNYFKTKMKYVQYGNYASNKAASYSLKSWLNSWLYSIP